MYVVRDTNHPAEDLKRNWSAPLGGFSCELAGSKFETAEEAESAYTKLTGDTIEFRFHAAYNSFVEVHYEGLGAYQLNSETLEGAIEEARAMKNGLACTMEAGDGHFYAEDVISYHKVSEGRYIFEIK